MSYAAKAVMFATLAKGGSMQISELTDYPGVHISRTREDRNAKTVQLVTYRENEFKTIAEAVEAWQKDQNGKSED
jgi:hypothetical protein